VHSCVYDKYYIVEVRDYMLTTFEISSLAVKLRESMCMVIACCWSCHVMACCIVLI